MTALALNNKLELEQRVLENLMHFGDHNNLRVQKAMLKLSSDCFYNPDCKELFAMICQAYRKHEPFNFVDMLVEIPRDNAELHAFITWIMDNYGKFHVNDNIFEHDVDKIILLSTLRKQVKTAERMISDVKSCASPEGAQEILIKNISEVSNLTYRESKFGITNAELAEKFYDGELKQDLIIPTTCDQLNQALCGGIMSKSLITIAAGAGVGKTGFAIYLLDAIARMQPDRQSLFFSLEMESQHIWMRHVGICAGKQFDTLTEQMRLDAIAKCLQVPIKIYDSSDCRAVADIDFILTTARMKAMEKPLSVIVVDYLGLVENSGKFERNDLRQADITSKLAKLALELNCVVIALSQINRGSATRAKDDQCPWPQDAADSSGSHRSSTLWLGVDRPELYQDDPCFQNQFVIKCRKNRFGGHFELILAFNGGAFKEVSNNYFSKPLKKAKNASEAVFSSASAVFSERQYVD